MKFFLASTSEVYGKNPKPHWTEEDDLVLGPTTRPRWSYGASKAIDEFLALAYWRERRLPVVVARLFNVVGPRQTGAYGMVLPRLVDAALGRRSAGGARRRAAAAVLRPRLRRGADDPGPDGSRPRPSADVFNVGSDQPVSILELARRVMAAVGRRGTGTGDRDQGRIRDPKSANPLPLVPPAPPPRKLCSRATPRRMARTLRIAAAACPT